MKERQTDPTQVSVQLNISVPWQFREDLVEIASQRGTSLAELVREAIKVGLSDDLVKKHRKLTAEFGATK